MSEPASDSGFTLIEVLVAITLMGILMAIAVMGFSHYSSAHQEAGTARSLQSALRQAQERAVSDGRAVCVKFDDVSWSVWRTACNSTTGQHLDGPTTTESVDVHLQGLSGSELVFTPRGTASWSTLSTDAVDPLCGSVKAFAVKVTRSDSTKTYRLCIPALTGRVDLHG